MKWIAWKEKPPISGRSIIIAIPHLSDASGSGWNYEVCTYLGGDALCSINWVGRHSTAIPHYWIYVDDIDVPDDHMADKEETIAP